MADVLIPHSALGLRPAVAALADDLRAAGHAATAPDPFEGRTFEGGEAGYAEAVAFTGGRREEIQAAADAAYDSITGPRIVLGFSMGAGMAQEYAQQKPEVVGAILVGGGGFYEGWTEPVWRAGVPLALHHTIDDPWMDGDVAGMVQVATRAGSDASDYTYPGNGHLFFDEGLPLEYDAASAALLRARLHGFLGRFDNELRGGAMGGIAPAKDPTKSLAGLAEPESWTTSEAIEDLRGDR